MARRRAVAAEALEAPLVEEDAAVEVPRRERDQPAPAGRRREGGEQAGRGVGGGAEAAEGAEVVGGEAGRGVAEHHLDEARLAHQGGDADRGRAPGGHRDRALEDDVLEDRDLVRPPASAMAAWAIASIPRTAANSGSPRKTWSARWGSVSAETTASTTSSTPGTWTRGVSR